MKNALCIADLQQVGEDDEPRVLDLRLAEHIGYPLDRLRRIRELIVENLDDLETYGPLPVRPAMVSIGSGAQREVEAYLLNEAQAIRVCTLAKTERAKAATREVITVFMAWRRGCLLPANQAPSMEELRKIVREETQDIREAVECLANAGREHPTPETLRIHGKAIDYFYYGYCPFNEDLKIREDGEWIIGTDGRKVMDIHHQYHRNDGSLEATIPLHRISHKEITKKDKTARAVLSKKFDRYQDCVSRLLARGLGAPEKRLDTVIELSLPETDPPAIEGQRVDILVQIMGAMPGHTGYYKDLAIVYGNLNPHVKDPEADVRNGIYRYCDCKAHHTPKCQHLPILFVYVSPGTYKLTELGEQRLKELNAPRL